MRGLHLLALVALVGATTAGRQSFNPQQTHQLAHLNKHQSRNALDDAIVAMFEKFREKMPQGFPNFGIPPLEPFYMRHVDFNLTSELMDLAGFIEESLVEHLSAFVLDVCKVNILRTSLDLQFTFPVVNQAGLYDMDGHVMELPIYGTGPYTFSLYNLTINGSVNMATRLDGTVYIKDMPLNMALQALVCNFEGLMGGGAMGETMNQLLGELAPILLDSVQQQFLGPISQFIMTKANTFLADYTMAELIDLILNGPGGGGSTAAPIL